MLFDPLLACGDEQQAAAGFSRVWPVQTSRFTAVVSEQAARQLCCNSLQLLFYCKYVPGIWVQAVKN